MAVISITDQTNWNNVWLKFKFQLTEMKHPWKFMQFLHFYFSTHDSADQPDQWPTGVKTQFIFCVKLKMYNSANQLASTDDEWICSDLARAAYFSLSSFNETIDSLTSLTRHSNPTSSIISHGVSLGVSLSFGLLSSSLYSETMNSCWTILLTSSGHNIHVTWFCIY